jgi:Raf kinase inhibitor-like YbhB/YbcL family protein
LFSSKQSGKPMTCFSKISMLTVLAAFSISLANAEEFVLSSAQIKPGDQLSNEQVFKGFGCDGDNKSPSLSWKGAPDNTKSYAVTLYDPDAPTGSGWWHWVVFNIPAATHSLDEGAGDIKTGKAPKGSVQSETDFGVAGFGGACPPEGDKPHRYQFTIVALDVDQLPLKQDASGAMVGFYLNQHALAKAVLEATYSR